MINNLLTKIWGSLKLYWQHVCLVVIAGTWIIWVNPKTIDAWERLAYIVLFLAFGYSAARLLEKPKNGNG